MGRGGRLFRGVLAAVLFLAASPSARAEPEAPIRLQYEAFAGCPGALQFFYYVRVRTARVRLAEPDEEAEPVSVRVEPAPDGAAGTLELPNPGGSPFVRRVEAATCSDVLVALSLVLALAYDPDALAVFPPAPAAAPAPAPVPPPAPAAPPPAVAESPRVESSPAMRADFGLDGHLTGGVGPFPQVGLGPFVEFGARPEGWWTPRVRAALLVDATSDVTAPSGRHISLGFLAGRVESCPATLHLADTLELSPCAGVDVGRIHAEGTTGVVDRGQSDRLWTALTFGGRVQWQFARRFFVEGMAALGFPFGSDKFVLTLPNGDQELVFEVPVAFGSVAIGAGMRFQ